MCYPKPGPRCSNVAKIKLLKAKRQLLDYWTETEGEIDETTFNRLLRIRDGAEAEYSITTAGLKDLERIASESELWREKLAAARAERARRLTLVKGQAKRKHRIPRVTPTYTRSSFLPDQSPTEKIAPSDADLEMMVQESIAWTHQLTPDEIATVDWYSQAGYATLNGYLSNPTNCELDTYTPAQLDALVDGLDRALAKADTGKEVVVYRRHFFYEPDGTFAHPSVAEMRQQLAVGDIYRPGFYLSTSLDPTNSPLDDSGGVAWFAIKTRRGASISACASQGTNEQEFLLPRDGVYRVVGNTKQLLPAQSHNRPRVPITIFELEEIV